MIGGDRLNALQILLRKCTRRHKQRGDIASRDENEMIRWLRNTTVDEARDRERQQPARLERRLIGKPARDAEDSTWLQSIEEYLPSFYRVETVLAERERAGTGCGPRIDE